MDRVKLDTTHREALSFPRVSSDSPEIKQLVETAFEGVYKAQTRRDYSRGFDRLCDGIYDALRRNGGASRLSVEYNGWKISFELEVSLVLNTFLGANHGNIFPQTNEGYGEPLQETLRGFEGITHYVGIAGGLAALTQLGILRHKNPMLAQIKLVDKSMTQLLFDALRLIEYDTSLDQVVVAGGGFRELHTKYDCPRNIPTIALEFGDMTKAIRDLDSKGRYFIYLSNAFTVPVFYSEQSESFLITGSGDVEETIKLANILLANSSISDGSYVMFASAFSHTSFIVRKEEGRFVLATFVDQVFASYSVVAPADTMLDLNAQEGFFNARSFEQAAKILQRKGM